MTPSTLPPKNIIKTPKKHKIINCILLLNNLICIYLFIKLSMDSMYARKLQQIRKTLYCATFFF